MHRPWLREWPGEFRRAADMLADLEQIKVDESLICLFIGLDALLACLEGDVGNNTMERA